MKNNQNRNSIDQLIKPMSSYKKRKYLAEGPKIVGLNSHLMPKHFNPIVINQPLFQQMQMQEMSQSL